MKKTLILAALLAVVSLGVVGVASVDSLTVGDMQFTATVTATTVTLTVQCTDSACSGWYLGDVTLKGFTFSGIPTDGAEPAGYTVLNGGQDNSGPGSGGGCNSTQPDKGVWWDVALPSGGTLGNGVWAFTAEFNDGALTGGAFHG